MVPHPDNVIYIHIPKTGGSSIRYSIMQDNNATHSTAIAYRRKDGEFFDGAYKFSIIRNPLDRAVSTFHYAKQRQGRHKIFNSDTFGDFCRDLERNSCNADRPSIFPQAFWVTDEFGRMMIDDLFPFDFIDDAIEVVKEKTGIARKLNHINKSSHNPFMSYHTDETIRILRKLYPYDFSLYEQSMEAWNG
jgi:hypothetical protein